MREKETVFHPERTPGQRMTTAVHTIGCGRISSRPSETTVRASWRLYWMPEGGTAVEHDGKRYEAAPNRILIIPPHTPVRQTLHRPCLHYWLHVNYGQPFDGASGFVAKVQTCPWFCKTIEHLQSLPRGENKRLLLASSLAHWAAASIPADLWPAPPADPRVRRAMERMQEHPEDRSISNDTLALEASMSRNAFLRLFRQEADTPPNAYLIQCRLDRACGLLQSSDLSIDRIAEESGLGSRSYMSRLFRQRLGTSPAAYRRGE